MSSEGTPLHGDRSAWNVVDFDTEHAKDISDSALQRHLPLPGAAGGIAQSDGTDWQRVSSLPLADIAAYSRGYIIRGGTADWEAYDANNSGFILVGDGTDIASIAFDWDTMAAGSGADMVHTHTSDAEGSTLGFDILTGDCDLADIAGYTRGYIIRGGASDWEAHDASTSGFILVGDGTDVTSVCFDWDTMAGGASADMVHSHASNAEGGQISHDSALSGVSVDDHHSETHVINSTGPHAEGSLTIGHFLRATGAAAFSFAAIAAGDLPTAIDAAKIADGSVSNTEFQYLDDYATIGLKDLASAEVDQLENIASTTISAAQWAYLGLTNQGLASTDSPTFNAITATSLIIGGNTITTTEWANLDGLNQTLATTSSPTFAALTISASGSITMPDAGWLGIAGNELLTVNAAGNFTFSGVTSVVVPDGCWVGADAACSWVFDSTNGDVTTLDKVGSGIAAPGYQLHVYSTLGDYAAKIRSAHGAAAGHGLWIDTRWNVATNFPLRITSNMGTSELMVVTGPGDVGFSVTAPQGLIHGYDAISGFMHWQYDGVDGTARTVHTNVAGDVLYLLSIRAVARASDGGVQSNSGSKEPGETLNVYDDAGGNVCTLTVVADGSITVQRTAGALTYKVALWLLWI